MRLREFAHARAGDKGNISNISVIAYDPRDFAHLERELTAERVREHFAGIVFGEVRRYVLPGIGAMNFVMNGALGGGVTRSLALDAHGKCLASAILEIEIGEAEGSGLSEETSHATVDTAHAERLAADNALSP